MNQGQAASLRPDTEEWKGQPAGGVPVSLRGSSLRAAPFVPGHAGAPCCGVPPFHEQALTREFPRLWSLALCYSSEWLGFHDVLLAEQSTTGTSSLHRLFPSPTRRYPHADYVTFVLSSRLLFRLWTGRGFLLFVLIEIIQYMFFVCFALEPLARPRASVSFLTKLVPAAPSPCSVDFFLLISQNPSVLLLVDTEVSCSLVLESTAAEQIGESLGGHVRVCIGSTIPSHAACE